MFDKLDDLLIRFEEVLNELGEPGVTDNQEHFQKLMKEQSDLQPIFPCLRRRRTKICVRCSRKSYLMRRRM